MIKIYKIFLFVIFSLIFLISCNEEKIINDVEVNQKFAIVVDSLNPKLLIYDTKQGVLANDKYFDVNGKTLVADVTKISEYGGMMFLLMPKAYKIEVVDKFTFKSLATIDFSVDKLEPSDICFANSTDAYVCHGNDTSISLVDIYNLQIARKIKVGRNPVSLACAGNQIYVANQGDNTVSVVDSRTHKQEAIMNVNTAPSFVAASNDNEKVLVVSLGDGKLNKEKEKTEAKATFFNVNNRTITADLELGTLKTKATDQEPIGLVLTISDWAYIQTKTHLFRLDAKRESGINTLSSDNNSMIVYHKLRNQMLIVNSSRNQVDIANANNAGKIKSFNINLQIRAIHPL